MIGTGYVGLVTAVGFAELGSDVWCIDIDVAKIERLMKDRPRTEQPGQVDAFFARAPPSAREELEYAQNVALVCGYWKRDRGLQAYHGRNGLPRKGGLCRNVRAPDDRASAPRLPRETFVLVESFDAAVPEARV